MRAAAFIFAACVCFACVGIVVIAGIQAWDYDHAVSISGVVAP
jgi:hypothetical protein